MEQKGNYDLYSDDEVKEIIKKVDVWAQENLSDKESTLLHSCLLELSSIPIYKRSDLFGHNEFKQIICNAMSNILNSEKKGLAREIPLWGKG